MAQKKKKRSPLWRESRRITHGKVKKTHSFSCQRFEAKMDMENNEKEGGGKIEGKKGGLFNLNKLIGKCGGREKRGREVSPTCIGTGALDAEENFEVKSTHGLK